MEERRIALPFVKPASLIISTISKPDLFNGSLANNFVAKSLAPLFYWHRVNPPGPFFGPPSVWGI